MGRVLLLGCVKFFTVTIAVILAALVTHSSYAQQIYQSPPRLLVPELGPTRSVESYSVSPDGQFVVYVADKDGDNDFELFVVPVDGGDSVKLNASLAVGADIDSFKISPASDRVVYLADQNETNVTELFSVPIGGGMAAQLNAELVENGDVLDYFFTPDSSRVVYLADQDEDEKIELYSAPSTGGATEKLSIVLIGEGDIAHAVISPNSQQVIYSVDDQVDEQYNIYSVGSDGGASTKLNDTLMILPSNADDHKVSFDSTRVMFIAKQAVTEPLQLFSNDIAGGTPVRLNGNLVEGGNVSDFKVSPSDDSVVYRADQIDVGVPELFATKSFAQQVTRINGSLTDGGKVEKYQFSPDGMYLVYQAKELTNSSFGIYSKDLTSNAARIHLNGDDISNQFSALRFGGLSSLNNLFYAISDHPDPQGLWLLSLNGKKKSKKILQRTGLGTSDASGFSQFEENPTLTETNTADTHAVVINRVLGKSQIVVSAVPLIGDSDSNTVTRVFPLESVSDFRIRPFSYSIVKNKNTAVIHTRINNSPLIKQLYAVDNVGFIEPEALCLPVKTKNNKLVSFCL